jgi:lysosomal Pro-X carboxypeptidase
MIGAWARIKYPNAVDGVIAASAPIWSFVGLDPPYDTEAFSEGVTHDLSEAGGSAPACLPNLKAAWPAIEKAGHSAAGLSMLSKGFSTCQPIADAEDAYDLMQWAQGPWANMAMGNYPYPSTYLMHGKSWLPAYPIRAACEHLAKPGLEGLELFQAVRDALSTQLNNTGTTACFFNQDGASLLETDNGTTPRRVRVPGAKMTDTWRLAPRTELEERERAREAAAVGGTASPESCQGDWGYQWCTEMVQPFTTGCGGKDFHYPCDQYNYDYSAQQCQKNWGVRPRELWCRQGLGGKRIEDSSNIVFSNGLLDPWHGGGILSNISESLIAVQIPNGAHHIDLMFSNPLDTPDIKAARATELAEIRKWVVQVAARHAPPSLP